MAVTLDPRSIGKNANPVIKSTTGTRLRRLERVRNDLDHYYIELDTQKRAQALQLPYIDLYGFPIDTNHLITLKREEVTAVQMGVFTIKNREIYLATPNPGYPGQSAILTRLEEKGMKPKIFLCSNLSLSKLLKTYNSVVAVKEISDDIEITQEKIDNSSTRYQNLANLQHILTTVSTSEIIETILVAALNNNASDIHFEPEKETYTLRLRLDGVLHTFAQLPKETQKVVESRIKIISKLKLNVDNVPQDGRFSFHARDKEIDVRVSMLPSNYGYSIVMRLLGTGSVALNLDQLGFTGVAKDRVQSAITKPQGLILTTGPTGSGKTTTLYTFLESLNDGESKIITLEDPIEYKLRGISQTQIDAQAGYTFSSGLRSILRQDPDIVMVGEIRDRETAEIAIQASLTGHQVLSTIHTNDAAGSIPRLMEMGVKGFLLADSLAVVIGQRLVRRLCTNCKYEEALTAQQQQTVIEQLTAISPSSGIQLPSTLHFYSSKGCNVCNNLGYRGRIGIYEVMTITNGLRDLLSNQFPSIVQVRQVATQEGMITMLQDGIIKALEGHTDMKEILRNIT